LTASTCEIEKVFIALMRQNVPTMQVPDLRFGGYDPKITTKREISYP
jgi:hypothetical protein